MKSKMIPCRPVVPKRHHDDAVLVLPPVDPGPHHVAAADSIHAMLQLQKGAMPPFWTRRGTVRYHATGCNLQTQTS